MVDIDKYIEKSFYNKFLDMVAFEIRSPTIEDLKKLAIEVGLEKTGKTGKFLSKKFTRMDEKHLWECGLCHEEFLKRPSKVKFRRSWCKNCSQGYYEKICRGYMEKIFSYIYKREIKFPKTSLDRVIASRIGYRNVKNYSLKFSKHCINKMHLDGYNEELGIGFERNGRQHYERVGAWHPKDKDFKNQISIDNFRQNVCEDVGVILIVVGFEKRNGDLQRVEPEEMQDCIVKQYEKYTEAKINGIPNFDFKKFFIDSAYDAVIHLNKKQIDVMRELDGTWHFITDLEKFNSLKHIYGVRQVILRLFEKGYLSRKRALNPNSVGTKKIQNIYTLSRLGKNILSAL